MDTSSGKAAGGARRAGTAHRWKTAALWGGAGLVTLVLSNLVAGVPLGYGDELFTPGPILALLGIATAVVLVRRAPLVTLGLMLCVDAALLFVTVTPGLTIAAVMPAAAALGTAAATRPRRTAVTALAITVLLLVLGQFGAPTPLDPTLLDQHGMPLPGDPALAARTDRYPFGGATLLSQIQLPIVVAAWLIGDSVRRRRESAAQEQARATEQALAEERLRIARELHDLVAHSIGIIAIQAGVGSRVIDRQPAQAREALQAIEATSRETLASLRRTLVALRRSEPAPLAPTPGLDGLEQLAAATASDTRVRIEVVRSGERRPLPQDIELAAYRIVQESLTNVVRHAGAATCRVSAGYGDGELALEITDDGRGAAVARSGGGFGITGMRERAALLGGRFEAGPVSGGGFRVAVGLPVEPVGPADPGGREDEHEGEDEGVKEGKR
ncbi:sensor histidine kinase [Streptomyces sp. NPDC090445]|uniref:sensor histidine kinase n=1 Tax=Streptomyces sp. NPDC090445 TaxID=3365963 RepID=UPI00380F781B